MSRATRLINRLDKVLARHDSFGDDPAAFVDSVFAEIEEQLELVKAKSNPEADIMAGPSRALKL